MRDGFEGLAMADARQEFCEPVRTDPAGQMAKVETGGILPTGIVRLLAFLATLGILLAAAGCSMFRVPHL
jgi:hypothetical protein